MKKTGIILLLLFITCCGMAQITIQPILPEVGIMQKSQLWNILAINNSDYPLNCNIVLTIQDRQTGAEVLSATTSTFTLEKGSKQLNEANLDPQYTYFSGDKMDQFLTVGSYMACFKFTGQGHLSGAELNEVCVPFDVAPLSPPILILPADSSVLQTQPAQFSWQPPAPLTMFQQLHYEILVAEILPGQKPEEAVELNAPFYIDLNVPNSVMNYTGAYPSFEKGKWYAWQVVAQDGESYAAKTQVWDFEISTQQIPAVQPVSTNYVLLLSDKEPSEGVHELTSSTLSVKYYSYDKDYTGTITFIGPDGNEIEEKSVHIAYGENFFTYKLDNNFKKETTYSM
ncbi:MAG TPA: hypothetical protein VK559_11580, partial [Ferruginibacter sp.]|nr:hypothetical protein [Ferruginibacter sp.]